MIRTNTAPDPGWSTPCHVARVVDGDTVEVIVTRRFRVRLLDCWAPESRTTDAAEKRRGLAAKASLEELTGWDAGAMDVAREAVLFVPSSGEDVAQLLSLGRVLGRLYVAGQDVAAEQVRRGHATTTKGGAS